ncbi:MAG: tRNA (adenosine(37)-N6)-dimethylallyltransferase MiaA [Candidatus Paceibacterota bacterium]
MNKKPKIIVILGPTAAGKTSLSIKLAKELNGEVVSADSRQVYKDMDLGTGKVTEEEAQGIPHHLIDVVEPEEDFNVVQFQELAYDAIDKILNKNKLPFLVGGSPFYLYSIIDGYVFPGVAPKPELREKLQEKPADELYEKLKKLDPERAEELEKNNKRRVIRSIEIAQELGEVPDLENNPRYNCLLLGIKHSREVLKKRIAKRLEKRFDKCMIQEVKDLHKQGVSWEQLEEFGLEYRWIARFLQDKVTKEEMKESLQKDIEQFAKRQMTWFKKDDRIHWVENKQEAEELAKNFLN